MRYREGLRGDLVAGGKCSSKRRSAGGTEGSSIERQRGSRRNWRKHIGGEIDRSGSRRGIVDGDVVGAALPRDKSAGSADVALVSDIAVVVKYCVAAACAGGSRRPGQFVTGAETDAVIAGHAVGRKLDCLRTPRLQCWNGAGIDQHEAERLWVVVAARDNVVAGWQRPDAVTVTLHRLPTVVVLINLEIAAAGWIGFEDQRCRLCQVEIVRV